MANTIFSGGQKLLGGASFLDQVVSVLNICVLAGLLFSVFFALYTASPRISITKVSNLFFFGSMTALSQEDYVNHFMASSLQDIKISVLKEIHARSFIIQSKFLGVQRSVNFLIVAVVIWSLTRILLALI